MNDINGLTNTRQVVPLNTLYCSLSFWSRATYQTRRQSLYLILKPSLDSIQLGGDPRQTGTGDGVLGFFSKYYFASAKRLYIF